MKFFIYLAIFLNACLLFGKVEISNVSVVDKGGVVKISWDTAKEDDIERFELEKSFDGVHYSAFTYEKPKGDNSSYIILDKSPFTKRGKIAYRISVVDKDDKKHYSKSINVFVSTSGISGTWGSIKAMFR